MKGLALSIYRWLMIRLAVRRNVYYEPDLRLGRRNYITAPDRLTIGRGVVMGCDNWIAVNGSIGNGVLVSSHVGIVGRFDHDMTDLGKWFPDTAWIYAADGPPRDHRHEVHIGDDVWIGFGAIVLSGVTIGRGAVVAAGAVVTQDVDPYAVVAGNPARFVRPRMSPEEIKVHEKLIETRAKNGLASTSNGD